MLLLFLQLAFLQLAFAADLSLADAMARASAAPTGQRAQAQIETERANARSLAATPENPALGLDLEPDGRTAQVEIPLDLALPARLGAAASGRELVDLREERAQVAVAMAAGEAWLDARRALDQAEAAEDLAQIAGRAAAAARARLTVGEIAADEAGLLIADAALSSGRALGAKAEADAAIRQLAMLVGASPTDLSLADWVAVPTPPSLEAADSPEAREAEAAARAAQSRAKLAGAERLPLLSVSGGWKQTDTDDGAVFGARIELPIFTGGAPSQAAFAEAQAQQQQGAHDQQDPAQTTGDRRRGGQINREPGDRQQLSPIAQLQHR